MAEHRWGIWSTVVVAAMMMRASPSLAGVPAASQPYKPAEGPYPVQVQRVDWTDGKRDRPVPAQIYSPQTGDGRFPVIIFSHGLGGSREGYEYLGRHWASLGYISVHLQHLGSDSAVWQGQQNPMTAMRAAAANPKNAIDRALDVSFAIDQMIKANQEAGPFKGRLDMQNIGVAGHSFGAYSALMIAGQVYHGPLGGVRSLGDPRVKAAVIMSAGPCQGTERGSGVRFDRDPLPAHDWHQGQQPDQRHRTRAAAHPL